LNLLKTGDATVWNGETFTEDKNPVLGLIEMLKESAKYVVRQDEIKMFNEVKIFAFCIHDMCDILSTYISVIETIIVCFPLLMMHAI
jgi:hypothetical protein